MPTVPVYDVPQVNPADPPDVRSYATAQAFGAGVGTAVAGIGKEIGQFGDVLAKHALLMQGQKNQAEADEAQVQFTIAAGELTREQHAMEGKKRAESYQQYVDRLEETRRKIGEKLTNPEARKAYDSNTRRQFSYSVAQEAGNAGRALKTYNSQSNQQLVTISRDQVIADPTNDAVFEEAHRTTMRAVDQEGANRTSTPEEIAFQRTEQTSALWGSRITSLAEKDPEAAQKMYEDNKEKLNAKDAQVVKVQINAGRHKLGTQAATAATGMRNDVEADLKSILATGKSLELPATKVKALLGEAEYNQYVERRRQAFETYELTNDAATITPAQMQKRLDNIVPQGADPNFTRKQNVHEAVERYYNERLKVRQVDPALSVSDSPTVKEITKTFGDDPGARPMLLEARIAAQTLAGIPKDAQSPITVQEANELMAPITRALPGQEQKAIAEIVKKAQTEYGEPYWKDAVRFGVQTKLGRAPLSNDIRSDINTALGVPEGSNTPEIPGAPTRREPFGATTPAATPKGKQSGTMTDATGVEIPFEGMDEFGGAIKPPAEKKKEPLSKRIREGK